MKALPTVSALVLLTATLHAMPAYRLETTPSTAPAANGFQNTQIGYSDQNKPAPAPVGGLNGTRFDFAVTNGGGTTSAAGGFGGSTAPFNQPVLGPPILGPSGISSGDGGYGGSIAQPNGPSLPVPEPSSSWFLLALALIPILKVRSNRKTRAS